MKEKVNVLSMLVISHN